MTFRVYMTAVASVSSSYEVEAGCEEEARRLAVEAAKAGNVLWKYDGADDSTVEVEYVRG